VTGPMTHHMARSDMIVPADVALSVALAAAGAEIQTGGMIALIPDNPQAFTVSGGDPAAQMHMTLCFLGDVSELDDATREELVKRVQVLAADNGPVEMRVQGVGIWNRDGGDTGDRKPSTNTLLQPTDQAQNLRDYADQIGRDALGARYPEQFRPWAPHICAGFDLPPETLPMHDGVVRFSKVRLALAGEDQDFALVGPSRLDEPTAGNRYSKIGVVEMTDTKTDVRPKAPADVDASQQPGEIKLGKVREDGTVPAYFPCLAVEGMETADGRYIEPGALQVRTPPLSVFAQFTNTGQGGHSGAEISGNLTEAWRIPGPEFISRQTGEPLPEGTFVWQGRGEVDTNTTGGKLFWKRYLRGNSVDLSEVDAYDDIQFDEDQEHHRVVVTKGFINATTLCAIPAFPDAYGEIEGEEGGYSAAMAARELELDAKYPKTIEGLQAFLRDRGIQPVVASFSIPELGDACSPCLASAGEEELGTLPPALRKKAEAKKAAAKDGDTTEPDDDEDDGKPAFLKKKISKGRTASAAALPPIEYFTDPGFSEPTPLTIDGDRIFGHIATWGTCHIGISKRCTPPPRSKSDYAYFNVGAKRVQDGDAVRTVGVGHLTMNTGHASLNASLAETLAHYDNTGTCAATVAAGEDRHGIWINGLVEPELSERDRERLAAAPPSGDWRPKGGALELCAVLAVNVPGYPVPRARVAAAGVGEEPEVLALVAAGATKPASAFGPGGIDLDDFADRVSARVLVALEKAVPEVFAADPGLAGRQQDAALALRQLEAVEAMRPFPGAPTGPTKS